jgi:hypothetical protein
MKIRATLSLLVFLMWMPPTAQSADTRQLVKLPQMMQEHMLSSMRDHLLSVHEIQAALAKGEFDKAADVAESRLGMSSLESHGAEHMAPYMPKAMQEVGTAMHHAASRFALKAKEGDATQSLAALVEVTQQCVACHAGYRIR